MSTTTFRSHRKFDALAPVQVSELPAATLPVRPSLLTRLRTELAARREVRCFELATRFASPSEFGDLLAARRRDF